MPNQKNNSFNMELYWQALDYFQLDRDPFGSGINPENIFETGDVQRIKHMVERAARDYIFCCVVGKPGDGKSASWSYAQRELSNKKKTRFIEMPVLEIDKTTITNIVEEIMTALQGFKKGFVHRTRNRRERMLVEALAQEHCVLVIDEAQLISPSTLRAIKRLWTLKYAGKSPLLSIILFGQKQVDRLINDQDEVNKRVVKIRLRGLTDSEIAGYLEDKIPGFFPSDVAVEISKYASSPLDINNLCKKILVSACLEDRKQATIEDVASAVGISWLRMRREKLGYTRTEFVTTLAKQTGIDRRTIEQVEKGMIPAPNIESKLKMAAQKMEALA